MEKHVYTYGITRDGKDYFMTFKGMTFSERLSIAKKVLTKGKMSFAFSKKTALEMANDILEDLKEKEL